jgi:hypothetical protein
MHSVGSKLLLRLFFLSPLVFIALPLQAQEHTTPITSLKALQNFGTLQRLTYSLDTINLPLVDDFSNTKIWPSPSIWTDNFVYINTDLAISPPTIGVATFDGLNPSGRAYDTVPSSRGLADQLTSQAVNLQNLSVADSVYLSFFWQPAGHGEQPESTDSLSVEFWGSDSVWRVVWSQRGTALQPFRQELLGLLHPRYFHSGFRFRISAYGSLTGLVDLWHIDYVTLARARNQADTLYTDVAIKELPNSPLAPLRRVPYKQLLSAPGFFPSSPISLPVTNLGIVDRNMAHSYTCVDAADNSLVQSAPTQIISPFTALSSRTIDYPSFAIPVRNSDSLNLDFTYIIQANPDDRRANDTLRTRLSLWNDYAYDDGTAETGYGINLLGTSIAYKFYVATPDTLRGVWMYFIEAAESAARELFNLKVWSRIGENSLAGGETMLTQMERQKPQHSDSLGIFVFYPLDTPVLVRDSFYVGWQQLSTRLLNIGLDRNSPVQGVKWTSVQGTWQPSSISGSWMIRPVLDDSLSFPAAVHHRKVVTSPLFYPNPTNGLLRIRWDMLPDSEIQESKTFQLRLRDIGGRIVEQQTIQTQQNPEITEVANGLYFLELSTSDRIIHTQKILIQR